MGRILFLMTCVLLLHQVLLAQDTTGGKVYPPGDSLLYNAPMADDVEIEELFDELIPEEEDDGLLEKIEWLIENPLNLNTSTRSELETIPGVSPAEAMWLVDLRRRVKKFINPQQIAAVGEIGESLYEKIRPYVYVESVSSRTGRTRTKTNSFRTRVLRDLQPRRGFNDGAYVGSSLKGYSRISITPFHNVESGVVLEKDAGERIGDGFASGYLRMRDLGFVSEFILGDFIVESGQGLVFWRGMDFGKGSETITSSRKSASGIQPYRSTDEFNYYRGGTARFSFDVWPGRVDFIPIYSRRLLDASPKDSQAIGSFYESGLFRTQTELSKRRAVEEELIGASVKVKSSDDFIIGINAFSARFDKWVTPNQTFGFEGSQQNVMGVNAEYKFNLLSATLSGGSVFGEVARSGDRATAWVLGSILNLTRSLGVSAIYRDYSPQFNNMHAFGFGERSETQNEKGLYLGIILRPSGWLTLRGYVDQFSFPWRTYTVPFPVKGSDMFFQVEGRVTRNLDLAFRFAEKKTEAVTPSLDEFGRDIRVLADRIQQKFRLTATHSFQRLRIRGRIEVADIRYSQSGREESGLLLYQDVKYALSSQISLEGRYIVFDTPSYDSRVYEYENDLKGVLTNPPLYGKGHRWYLLVNLRPLDGILLSVKYSETQKESVISMGSGTSEILGDLDNRLSLQLEWRF